MAIKNKTKEKLVKKFEWLIMIHIIIFQDNISTSVCKNN